MSFLAGSHSSCSPWRSSVRAGRPGLVSFHVRALLTHCVQGWPVGSYRYVMPFHFNPRRVYPISELHLLVCLFDPLSRLRTSASFPGRGGASFNLLLIRLFAGLFTVLDLSEVGNSFRWNFVSIATKDREIDENLRSLA